MIRLTDVNYKEAKELARQVDPLANDFFHRMLALAAMKGAELQRRKLGTPGNETPASTGGAAVEAPSSPDR